jgi:hypothetical protein
MSDLVGAQEVRWDSGWWHMTASVVYWLEFLTTDAGVPGSIPGHYKKVVGLERGPLSSVSTTEELLDRKVAAPV